MLFGRSDPESLVPYQPFVTAVQHAMAHRESVTLPAELEPELSELARLVPALRRHLPTARDPIAEDPETRRYRMFEAVTRLLAFLARERPTVLILDDLQWADTSTALLLGHLLRDVEATRLLVLGTFRDGVDVRCPELPALLGQLAREPAFERIALSGLDGEETGDADRLLRRAPRERLLRPAPARGHRGQPVLRQGDDAQPGRGGGRRRRPRARARGPDRPGRRQGAGRDAAGPRSRRPPGRC